MFLTNGASRQKTLEPYDYDRKKQPFAKSGRTINSNFTTRPPAADVSSSLVYGITIFGVKFFLVIINANNSKLISLNNNSIFHISLNLNLYFLPYYY